MSKNLKNLLKLAMLLLVLSCSKESNLYSDGLTLSEFEYHLKPSMTYDKLVSEFGAPVSDIGSGIHIYVYKLTDSTEIWIGFTDRILYARHMSPSGQLLKTLI